MMIKNKKLKNIKKCTARQKKLNNKNKQNV